MKVFLLSRHYMGIDDGIAGIFSTREKATAFFEENRSLFYGSDSRSLDSYIEEFDLDPKEAAE